MFLSANGKLVAVLTTAKTTLNMPVTVDYVDLTTTTTVAAPYQTYTNGTTVVDILPAPAASTVRKVNGMTIYGRDTAAKIVRVYKIDSTPTTGLITAGAFVTGNDYQIVSVGTTDFTLIGASANTVGVIFTATGVGTGTGTAATAYQLVDLTLQIDDSLCYTDTNGFYTVDAQGNLKSVQAASATAIATAIHGATDKVTPVGADELGIWDSVTGLLNKVSFTNALNWFAAKLGNAANVFSVAPATAAAHAVRSDQISADNTNFPIYTAPTAWTPVVVSSGGGAPTYSVQDGSITRIGKRRFFDATIILASLGTLAAGDISITGLPDNSATVRYTPFEVYNNAMSATVASGCTGLISPSSSNILMYYRTVGGSSALTVALLTTTAQIMISGSYTVP